MKLFYMFSQILNEFNTLMFLLRAKQGIKFINLFKKINLVNKNVM